MKEEWKSLKVPKRFWQIIRVNAAKNGRKMYEELEEGYKR